ncbi:MAG: glycoside hydrolase family 92 protein, partial [Clostridia bacterium]|nr:glycoside hydrolase family 92 protein [Clostridia bacterium]
PHYGDTFESSFFYSMEEEYAKPGYYSVKLKESDIKAELTVSKNTAVHRYDFKKEKGSIAIDINNCGFPHNGLDTRAYSEKSRIKILSKNEFEAEVVMYEVPIYLYVYCPDADNIVLWDDYAHIKREGELTFEKAKQRYGASFEFNTPGKKEIRLSFSLKSIDKAKKYVHSETRSFEEIKNDAYNIWNGYLSKIEIEAPSERDRRIFYSNFYHTIIKPADFTGDSFIYDEDIFVNDFSTLWDTYKTQMPLLFMLYPEISSKIIYTFTHFCEKVGRFPQCHTLSSDTYKNYCGQSLMLAERVAYDAFIRGVEADWESFLKMAKVDLHADHMAEFHRETFRHASHIYDAADSCGALAEMCRVLGLDDSEFAKYENRWMDTIDRETGLLPQNGNYYEGSAWNDSFRPLRNMEERVKLAGGKEKFMALLDRFFGYTHPEDVSGRFEGYNNESDLEAPAAYHYCDGHDKLCEITNACVKYMFSEGRGGIPGNNDSGGTTSCYMWNALGLFPLSAQNKVLITSPLMLKSVWHLSNGKTLTVKREGDGIYSYKAVFNGKELDKMEIKASELQQGGELIIYMHE